MQIVEHGIPRRNRIDLFHPAELAIREAKLAVERAGAHVLLTDAINLLEDAQNKVADYVEATAENHLPNTVEVYCPDCGLVRVLGDVFENGRAITGMCPSCLERLYFA